MPKSIKVSDFSSGWCPSDDEKNGRQNGLLQMDNVELDKNGALSSIQGNSLIAQVAYPVYEIYSNVINGLRTDFTADTHGDVNYLIGSNVANLLTAGDPLNTAFSTAFDYTLICSGGKKVKTNITHTYNLGITNPTKAPVVGVGVADHTDILPSPNFHTQDWSNVRPAASNIVNVILCNCDGSEAWVNSGDAPFNFDPSAPPGFTSALRFDVPANTSKSFDLVLTFPSPVSYLTGSNDSDSDVFSWWFKQTSGSLAGLEVVITDSTGKQAVYGYNSPYFPSTVVNNSWINYSFGIRNNGATGSTPDGNSFFVPTGFDWSQIKTFHVYGPHFNTLTLASTIWIGGFEFIGLNVTSSTQPIEGSGSGWPDLTINKDKGILETDLLTTPVDFSKFPGTAQSQDSDIFSFFIRGGVSGQPIYGDVSCITSIQVSILLTNPGAYFNAGSDYFTYLWKNPGITGNSDVTININRADFVRNGNGSHQWNTVYGILFTVNVNNPVYVAIGGSIVPGVTFPGNYATFTFFGGSNSLNGTYQYFQVNVNSTGSYVAKSGAGPFSLPIDVVNGKVLVTPDDPTLYDAQVNEVWIFREGGTMDQAYRIKVLNNPNLGTQFTDQLSDTDAQEIDITWNFNLQPTNTLGKIFDIVGPIEARWYYFTADTMWPSDINDPDLVDLSLGVRTCGSSTEIFLWADKVSEAAVLVGTSKDVYILSGTFTSLPDLSIDLFYRPLTCANPPVTYDSTYYNSAIYYMSKDGWRTIDAGGNCVNLTVPNTDVLYRGEDAYGYTHATLPAIPGNVRFPVAINRNRLYCSITGTRRLEVLDLFRKSWRALTLVSDASALYSTQNGLLLGALGLNFTSIGSVTALAGSPANFNILTPQYDNGTPRQRKDPYTFRIRTGLQSLTGDLFFTVKSDTGSLGGAIHIYAGTQNDYIVDMSILAKSRWFQLTLTTSYYIVLEEIEIYYDDRPVELTFVRGFNTNYGAASKKRVRTMPFVIDTLGADAVIQTFVDNVPQPTLVVNTNEKTTVLYFFHTDVFGIDYGYTVSHTNGSATGFELWEAMSPEIVEVLPVAKQFDQVGPFDFQRYGKVQKIEFRILSYGDTIPFVVFMNDVAIYASVFSCVVGNESAYYINVPKGTSGNIIRIELGPTSFNFHRIAVRALCAVTGKDTEAMWINL